MTDKAKWKDMPPQLHELAKRLVTTAFEIFDTKGVHHPAFFVVDDSYQVTIIGADMPDEDAGREKLSEFIRQLGRDRKAIAIVSITEGWVASTADFQQHMNFNPDSPKLKMSAETVQQITAAILMQFYTLYREMYGTIEEMPWAKEGLHFTINSIWGTWFKTCFIDRSQSKPHAVDAEWRYTDVHAGGRFSDLLDPASFPPEEPAKA